MRTAGALLLTAGLLQPPMSMSDLMVKILYPTADAVFYIETRTPTNEAGWIELQHQTRLLADAAGQLAAPRWARGRAQWIDDAKLLVDASRAAVEAASRRDVKTLADLNDALYTSCVSCHQHFRPNYPRARSAPAARADDPPRSNSTRQEPDLQGVWSFATLTPLDRPSEFADKPFVTREEAAAYVKDLIERNNRDRRDGGADVDVARAVNGTTFASINGRIPASLVTDPPDGRVPPPTAEARAKTAARAADARQHPTDGPENRSLQERCLSFNAGPPMLPGPYNNDVQIFQVPGHVIISTEMIHDARIVPLDGRPHLPASVRSWLGDSRGRWEGQTLVVDTTNFNGRTGVRGSDENLHLVEQFTRVDETTLLYEFTVDDPTAFTKPWTAALPMTKTDDRIFEYACHEGNYALVDILRGARFQERQKQ